MYKSKIKLRNINLSGFTFKDGSLGNIQYTLIHAVMSKAPSYYHCLPMYIRVCTYVKTDTSAEGVKIFQALILLGSSNMTSLLKILVFASSHLIICKTFL